MIEMGLVHDTHEFHVPAACRHRGVVDAGAGEVEYPALLRYGQRMVPVDHFFALASSIRPSATDKKSFSIDSCPILA